MPSWTESPFEGVSLFGARSMEENPLDLELHEEETLWDAWKRRLMFALLMALCIAFAAPTFGSCDSAIVYHM